MDAADVALGQDLPVFFIDVNAVRGNDIGAEDAELFEILNRSEAVLVQAVVQFFFHFGNVNQDGSVILAGKGRRILESFFRARIDRVRSSRGMN